MAADNDAERRTREGGRHEKISRPATTTNFGGGGMHYSSPSPNFMSLRANERMKNEEDDDDDDDDDDVL